jgi:hypothetical protein
MAVKTRKQKPVEVEAAGLKIRPLSIPCQRFMQKVGEFDLTTMDWKVGDDYPREVILPLRPEDQQRWLSIMLAIAELMKEYGLKYGSYKFSPGGAIEILGIRK